MLERKIRPDLLDLTFKAHDGSITPTLKQYLHRAEAGAGHADGPQGRGRLDFDKLVTAYVPWLKGSAWDGITVKNAMNMASGFDIEETADDVGSGSCSSACSSLATDAPRLTASLRMRPASGLPRRAPEPGQARLLDHVSS